MIVRLGFVVAASIAAYAVKQLNIRSSRSSVSLIKPSENGELSTEQPCIEEDKEHFKYSGDGPNEQDGEEEEEKEEVKLISGVINPALGNSADLEDEILPEFENLLSGEIDFPLPNDKYDTERTSKAEKDKVYESEMADNANELERLRNLVEELEEREVKLEGELLEYYGLKEQESDITELQRQLKIKAVEIDMLNITINSLQAERKKLQEEVSLGASARRELEVARNKIKELQRQIQLEASQTKGQLLLLKQQVSGLQAKEEEAFRKDAEVERKLKAFKELEVEVVELKRKNKELQHEKRELTIKLDAAESRIASLSNLTEVKADVETQGDFVQSLATEVRAASFTNIHDLVSFVNWLDEELSFLVDERAVLKHFDWPDGKADALREAAFEYQDLVKLERQVSSFDDDPKLPCETALKKMYKLLEKVEQSVYALLRTRDMAVSRYREFGIPTDWLLDSGVVGKIKLSSVQLAKKYMKRVATELDVLSGPEKEPNREFLLLQGVRFAFRVHQFAGGFDADSMKAFEELRSRVRAQTGEDNKLEA